VNYAVAECNNKIFFYGGLDSNNEVLGSMEVFDLCTYKFTKVVYRGGGFVPKARQGAAMLALDKFTIVVVGGCYTAGFVGVESVPVNEAVVAFDCESGHWRELPMAKHSQPAPWNLAFCQLARLDA
jgi:hypothetical protein